MQNPTSKEQNVYKLRATPMKPFSIFKDTLLLLLKISKYINMLAIFYSKIAHTMIAFQPLVMVLI